MNNFKHFQEMTSQAATKDYEDKVLHFILNKDAKPKDQRDEQAKRAAKLVHDAIKKDATEGFKPGKATGYPGTRISQPKADIAFKAGKWYSVSVKLDGGFVLNSAENPAEFTGMFFAALDLYNSHFGDTNSKTQGLIDEYKKNLTWIADSIIGDNHGLQKKDYYASRKGAISRPVWDDVEQKYNAAIAKSKDGEVTKILKETKDSIMQRLKSDNEAFAGEYMREKRALESKAREIVLKQVFEDPNLKRCVIFEAMTGYKKFGSDPTFHSLSKSGPYANFVVSASGFKDLRDLSNPFFAKIESKLRYDIQTMPVPGKVSKYIDQITSNKNKGKMLSFDDAINLLQKVKLSSKLISSVKEDSSPDLLDALIEEVAGYESMISEGIVSKSKEIISKITNAVKSFFSALRSILEKTFKEFKTQLTNALIQIKAPKSLMQSFAFFNFYPTGMIKIVV